MRAIFTSNTALGAGAAITSPWLDRAGSGDVPYVTISIAADQAGTFLVYESETKTADLTERSVIGGGVVLPNLGAVFCCNVNRRNLQVVLTNGAVAQTTLAFSVVASSTPHIAATAPEWRALDLILRELRVQSLLLANLKEPQQSTVNLPFGPTNSGN